MTFDDLLAIDDAEVVRVACKAWKRDVFLRAPDAGRKDAFDAHIYDTETQKADQTLFRCRIVALCLCGEDGTFFCPDPIAGATALAAKSSKAIAELFETAKLLAGLASEEETVKN